MIRMTRVRLINWHNFIDDIVEFKTISAAGIGASETALR